MKFSLNWLLKYIESGLSPEKIGTALTLAGVEVDSIETLTFCFDRVIVAHVIHTEKHPQADKLCLATVSDGRQTYQVVCGAPNCRPGIKTAFAMVGATLRDEAGQDFIIKKAKVRGIESEGMLCSAKELQIGEESDKILEFPLETKEGSGVADLYADTLFEVSLTPNLGHCANMIGIARELSAITGRPISLPKIEIQEVPEQINRLISVKINDKEGCPRYASRLVRNVHIAPSPEWLQRRLVASGLRPVNNIVDISNYVVLEMGHPLHAFDYDRIEGHEIVVRSAVESEKFITLDGKERTLSLGDLLICDQQRPVALAGIMGGSNSEISAETKNVLLEAAYFQPSRIRKTSKRLGLMTDASRRFERGCDPNAVIKALDRAAMLIQQIAGGDVISGMIDIQTKSFPEMQVSCRLSRINQVLGTHLSLNEVENIFQRLGFAYHSDGLNLFNVTIPTYRVDITGEIDLVEEVARIYGYNNIEGSSIARYSVSTTPHSPIYLFEREVRSRLIGFGLQELLTCDLIGPTLEGIVRDDSVAIDSKIKVLNPTSIEQSILRTSLLPGLLNSIKYNIDHQNHNISGFEIGRIHFKENNNYQEPSVVSIVLTGKRAPDCWGDKSKEVDFFDLKGIIEAFFTELNIKGPKFQTSNFSTFHTGRQASIYIGELEVGTLGEIHPAILQRLDVQQRILFAEISLQDLMQVRKPVQKMAPLPVYPCSERDWTLTVKEELPVQDIFNAISQASIPLLEKVSLLDIYRSDKLGKEFKNVTIHFVYRDSQKTIEQEVVDAAHMRVITEVNHILENKK